MRIVYENGRREVTLGKSGKETSQGNFAKRKLTPHTFALKDALTQNHASGTLAAMVERDEFPIHPGPLDRTVLAWLPYLWQRALFPGPAAEMTRASGRSLLFLFAISSLVIYPSLNFRLFEPDEGRYAQIPAEMLARGDWLVPTLQGEPYLDKPPLFYWLVMLSYQTLGQADWTARLIPAIAIQLTILLSYLFGCRHVGERAAFWGGLFLSLSPGLVSMGRILVLDGLLTLWVTLGALAAFEVSRGNDQSRRWWIVLGLALGLGTLTKGPVALVLVLTPMLAHAWLSGCWPPATRRHWLALFAIVGAMNVPWYAAMTLTHPEFGGYFFLKHNFARFLTPFDHERPIWFFGPVLLLGLAPLLPLMPWFVGFLLSSSADVARHRDAALGYYLLAGAWCIFFFSLSGCKLPTYILPAFPPLCLAAGVFVTRTPWSECRSFRRGLTLWAMFLAIAHMAALPPLARHRSPMNHALEVRPYLEDPETPIFCFPRNVDSVAFYLGRDDLRTYRSKDLAEMIEAMEGHRRSVILFGHRSSSLVLTRNLPPHFRVVYLGKLGLCDMALVER